MKGKEKIDFVNDDTVNIAKKLLGKLLVYKKDGITYSGYIVETEAYLGVNDEACHSFKNKRTRKNEVMYREGGSVYIYTIHSHKLLNIVTGKKNIAEAVLIRAIEPKEGIKQMEKNRRLEGLNLTNGPGKLTRAFNISDDLKGAEIGEENIYIDYKNSIVPKKIISDKRVGITQKGECALNELRFYIEDNLYVSKFKKK